MMAVNPLPPKPMDMSANGDDTAARDGSGADLTANGNAKGGVLGDDLPPGTTGRKKVVHLRKVRFEDACFVSMLGTKRHVWYRQQLTCSLVSASTASSISELSLASLCTAFSICRHLVVSRVLLWQMSGMRQIQRLPFSWNCLAPRLWLDGCILSSCLCKRLEHP